MNMTYSEDTNTIIANVDSRERQAILIDYDSIPHTLITGDDSIGVIAAANIIIRNWNENISSVGVESLDDMIDNVYNDLTARYDLLKDSKYANTFIQYNDEVDAIHCIRRNLVVIDMHEVLCSDDHEVLESRIGTLARLGRAVGIYLLLLVNTEDIQSLHHELLDNIGNRIVMGYTNSSDVNDMLESTNALDIPRVESGHAGIISIYGKNEGFIISDD